MLSIYFEPNFSAFHSIRHIDLLTTAAQIKEFCHLFRLKYWEDHFAKKAIMSYVQEIKLRRDSLIARICHLVNMANARKHCWDTKLILVD